MSRPYAVSLLPHGPLQGAPLSCIKLFCGPFLLMLHRMISFLKRYQYHQTVAPSPSSKSHHPRLLLVFSISLLSEASPPPLRIILTHFVLSSYERALRLPTSFSISSLARLGVKPRLCRSSCFTRSCFPLPLFGGSQFLPCLTSLKPVFPHCGVHSFLSILPL